MYDIFINIEKENQLSLRVQSFCKFRGWDVKPRYARVLSLFTQRLTT